MAISEVSVCNLALQKLGATRITSLADNSVNARTVAACYEILRDKELRTYLWNFAKTRVPLAPSTTIPGFAFAKAFPLPPDFLRLIKPARLDLDWQVERHAGAMAILSNDGDTIEVRYIARVTNPALFDPCFVEMLATKIAWHCCESLTQSNTKKAALMDEYAVHRSDARKTNAFELSAQPEPIDGWLLSRQHGALVNTDWNEQ